MAYPPAPGLKSSWTPSGSSTPQSHPALPARPPPAPSSLPPRPAAHGVPGAASEPSGFSSFTGFKPRSVASNASPAWSQNNQSFPSSISAGPASAPGYQNQQHSYGAQNYAQQPYYASQPQQPYYASQPQQPYQPAQHSFLPTEAPQIKNPFPLPGQSGGGSDYDPEMVANIAQWQSAYTSKDEPGSKTYGRSRAEGAASAGGANAIPLGGRGDANTNIDISGAAPANSTVAAVVAGADGQQSTVVRSGGGQTWQDPSLLEWNPADFRIFIGNLAGEVTDDSLLKAFSRYTSVQKARVVRDKRTTKSKGYGFVSFSDGDDYFQAAKEMQGKYIGSHPVLIKRSTTEIKSSAPPDKKKHYKGKGNAGGRADTGAGVNKKQTKMKGGLKILG